MFTSWMRRRWRRSTAHQLCKSLKVHAAGPGTTSPSTAVDEALYVDDCIVGFCLATFLLGTLALAVDTKDIR